MSIVLLEFSLYKDALTGRLYEDSCVLSNSNVVSAATSVVNPVAVCSVVNGAQVIPARSHAVSYELARRSSSETLTSTITPPL